jgi:hypothetical protein
MSQLLDVPIDTKLKLCVLWISILLCLIYSDYFGLFTPGTFESIKAFRADPEHKGFLRAMWLMKASPIVMIFLSVALPAKSNRTLNIVVGIIFVLSLTFDYFVVSTLWAAANIPLSAVVILKLVVAAFAALVVWYAWKWPKTQNAV